MENTETGFQRWIVKIFHLPTPPFEFFSSEEILPPNVVVFTEEENFRPLHDGTE